MPGVRFLPISGRPQGNWLTVYVCKAAGFVAVYTSCENLQIKLRKDCKSSASNQLRSLVSCILSESTKGNEASECQAVASWRMSSWGLLEWIRTLISSGQSKSNALVTTNLIDRRARQNIAVLRDIYLVYLPRSKGMPMGPMCTNNEWHKPTVTSWSCRASHRDSPAINVLPSWRRDC